MKKNIFIIIFFMIMISNLKIETHAEVSTDNPGADVYEMSEKENYNYTEDNKKMGVVSYGERTLGNASIFGANIDAKTIDGIRTYGCNDSIKIGYQFDGSYMSNEKNEWNIGKSKSKTVGNISLKTAVGKGAIIIQELDEKNEWHEVCVITDFFAKNPHGMMNIYDVPVEEIKKGTRYRMIVAYDMKKQIEEGTLLNPDGVWNIYHYVEVYEFAVLYSSNAVILRDAIFEHNILEEDGIISISSGFVIDKAGMTANVYVSKDGGEFVEANDKAAFMEEGEYEISIISQLGDEYKYYVSVVDGTNIHNIKPTVYVSEDQQGYRLESKLTGNTVYGISSNSSLGIAYNASYDVSCKEDGEIPFYSVHSDRLKLYMELNYCDVFPNGWKIVDDKWGKKLTELVCGVQTGEVQSGALIIQKSYDGVNWTDETLGRGRYNGGLYTTDFTRQYGNGNSVLVYTPEGKDINKGVYIRVLYAYEIKNVASKEIKDYVEEYKFYLCSNDLEKVMFHNLDLNEKIPEYLEGEAEETIEMYRKTETLLNGSFTTSGFTIDTYLNPTVKVEVSLNDKKLNDFSLDDTFTENGKYDITLTSATGETRKVTIYVDKNDEEQSKEVYFGEAFITGKRVYEETLYPVYIGGSTNYHINAVEKNCKTITGKITNLTGTTQIDIISSDTAIDGELTEPGEYEAIFTTNDVYGEYPEAGDVKIFTFRFIVFPEDTDTKPHINQQLLYEYSHKSAVDSYPIYYGITVSSAAGGYITRAYATREAAVQAAYEYESSTVEKAPDGTFRYIGSFLVKEKEKYESGWDLTDAIYYFADLAVEKRYFDMSDVDSYRTLDDKLLNNTDNLRQLELQRSVIIFGVDQRELLTDIDTLPIISDKRYAYQPDGIGKDQSIREDHFEFVADSMGLDSQKIVIYDGDGKEYPIEYGRSVGKQLENMNCPTGIVTIHEENKYGDVSEYQAVFLAHQEITATLKVKIYTNDSEEEINVSQATAHGLKITNVGAFSLQEIIDELDPYDLVKVKNISNGEIYRFCAKEVKGNSWNEPGDYEISVVNRLGYQFTFSVSVIESNKVVVSFVGEGTENIRDIVTDTYQREIELPKVEEKDGFIFAGYKNVATGDIYKNQFSLSGESRNIELESILEARKYRISFNDSCNADIQTIVAEKGKEYLLPIPNNIPSGYNFRGWSMDGLNPIGDNILFEYEKDIELVPIWINEKGDVFTKNPTDEKEIKEDNDSSKLNAGIIAGIIVAVICGVGALVFIKIKKVK